MDIFLLYQYTVTAILLAILINFLVNNILFKNTSNYSLPQSIIEKNPLISVLIPARNEEKNIKRCIISLTKQNYSNIEIIVLDDNSTDSTYNIVSELVKKDLRIKVYKGKPLKKGWMGKSYACHQLAGYARGDYLAFTDADTLHFPNSISSAVASLLRYRLDALSVFPMQIMVTLHERMVVIFINFAVLCLVPIWLVRKIRSSMVSVANGQFMLFKKEVYRKIGGHRAVKAELIEDIGISKQVKRHGYRFMIFDGRSNLYCRMYKNFGGVVRGFSKFIFASMGYSTFNLLAVISMITVLFLFPFILLPLGIYCFDWSKIVINLIISQIIIIVVIKIVLSIRFKNRILDVLLHPLSMLYIIALSINSVYRVKSGHGIYWKGRTYSIDNRKEIEIVNDNFR